MASHRKPSVEEEDDDDKDTTANDGTLPARRTLLAENIARLEAFTQCVNIPPRHPRAV